MAAFCAEPVKEYSHEGELMALDLRLGDRTLSVCGANPRREAEPWRGGPFFPKNKGAVSTIFQLDVKDAEAVVKRSTAAGALVRDPLQFTTEGQRVASLFDPFGHIWGIVEKSSPRRRRAA